MKKIIKLLFVFLLGFMIIPMVNAEDLPREGVTYFLHYPDGHEEATTNYTEAANPQEKLIYSGVTDENGNIDICNWEREGKIRIVQHVPDGYTTNARELVLDLSSTNNVTANFVNYKGLINPTTGRTLLFLAVIAGVVGVTIVSIRNKKKLMIIPIVAVGLVATAVQAQNIILCPSVTVRDGQSKPLAGVQIDIYATPIEVDAAPAIKFDANGGTFFDGTTEMYFRIPNDPCSPSEFMNSLSDEEREYFQANTELAYRDGYYPDRFNGPDTLTNGSVIQLQWSQNNEANLLRVNGNGGFINFLGKKISETYVYVNSPMSDIILGQFENGEYRPIGYDNTPSCSNYNEFGINDNWIKEKQDSQFRVVGTAYVCWNNKPDGIYVNDVLFLGNTDTCYRESYFDPLDEDNFYLYSLNGDEIYLGDISTDDIFFGELGRKVNSGQVPLIPKAYETITKIQKEFAEEAAYSGREYEGISKIEIIKNGRTVVVLNSSDFEEENGSFYVGNDEKREVLLDYLAEMLNNGCITKHY